MSARHLAKGSQKPPKVEGKLRLYSMQYCPFAQRIRIVLLAKGVPHDIVNVHLKNKPEWLWELHPEGKVPALDTGDEVVVESLDIAEFLDKRYPQPPLYPDPTTRQRDAELLKKFGKVPGVYKNALFNEGNKTLDEHLNEIMDVLQEFEAELEKRGGPFFGGKQPGMVDYMIWPWIERAKSPSIIYQTEFNFPKDKLPRFIAWKDAIKEVDAVKKTITEPEILIKFLKSHISPEMDIYDDL